LPVESKGPVARRDTGYYKKWVELAVISKSPPNALNLLIQPSFFFTATHHPDIAHRYKCLSASSCGLSIGAGFVKFSSGGVGSREQQR